MDNQKGIIINEAYQIILKTYKEINRLKDDVADLLSDYEPSMRYDEEYSYGPKSLYLKPNHTYLFRRIPDESETTNIKEERYLAVICIFYEDNINNINRISLKDQPELWVALFDIKNRIQKCKPWDISYLLRLDEREGFTNNELRIGGDVFKYYWKDDNTGEEWKGRFVGYPLVEIINIEILKAKIMNKLFNINEKNDA